MDDFKLNDGELSGFGLAGWRQRNGVIELIGSKRFIDEWPKEIFLMGNTYTLEETSTGSINQETGARFENAEYM